MSGEKSVLQRDRWIFEGFFLPKLVREPRQYSKRCQVKSLFCRETSGFFKGFFTLVANITEYRFNASVPLESRRISSLKL